MKSMATDLLQVTIILMLPMMMEHVLFSFQPEDRDKLKTAVDEWIDNSTSANSTYGEINTWDTSLITDMSGLFFNSYSFNGDISDWDVSNVTDMSYMFSNMRFQSESFRAGMFQVLLTC